MADTVEKKALTKIQFGHDVVQAGSTFHCPVDQVEDLERLGAIAPKPKRKPARRKTASQASE